MLFLFPPLGGSKRPVFFYPGTFLYHCSLVHFLWYISAAVQGPRRGTCPRVFTETFSLIYIYINEQCLWQIIWRRHLDFDQVDLHTWNKAAKFAACNWNGFCFSFSFFILNALDIFHHLIYLLMKHHWWDHIETLFITPLKWRLPNTNRYIWRTYIWLDKCGKILCSVLPFKSLFIHHFKSWPRSFKLPWKHTAPISFFFYFLFPAS